jgi:sugar phosphate isomerase/epimerase
MAAGAVLLGNSLAAAPHKPLLSFSTLGCPAWTLPQTIQFASANGYNGLEFRGIHGEMDLTKSPEFGSKESVENVKRSMAAAGLQIVSLGSSAELHHTDNARNQSAMDEAKRYIELADGLDCRYIRVFPNALPANQDKKATLDLIAGRLNDLSAFASNSGVTVLMETHGDVVYAADIAYIMQHAGKNAGLIWDIYNMWSITKEPPATVYEQIKSHIRHIHVKDGKRVDGKIRYVLMGRGEAPVKEAVKALQQGGYKGFYSFEWEKRWHPEIEEPEVALPAFPGEFKRYFS